MALLTFAVIALSLAYDVPKLREKINLLNRITLDSQVCHGKPCVRGMRWPVEVITDMLSAGMSTAEILEDHPELEQEDIYACLQYARISLSGRSIQEVA